MKLPGLHLFIKPWGNCRTFSQRDGPQRLGHFWASTYQLSRPPKPQTFGALSLALSELGKPHYA